MKKLNPLLIALIATVAINASAQKATKKVTYNKTAFTLYSPIASLEPTQGFNFAPPTSGVTLKSSHYGAGTYYQYAPGKTYSTNYKCLLTELRDWLYYPVNKVRELAAQKGLKEVDEKALKKMFKNSNLPQTPLCYQLNDNSWIHFTIETLCSTGPYNSAGQSDDYVIEVAYIEKIEEDANAVLDRLYRFWNDGVYLTDHPTVIQRNSKTQPTPPSAPLPNLFAINEYLRPDKGYSKLSFEGGKPEYVWINHLKILEPNLAKADFSAECSATHQEVDASCSYFLTIKKSNKALYTQYRATANMVRNLEPGTSWATHIKQETQNKKLANDAIAKANKENAVALEAMYKEIFK